MNTSQLDELYDMIKSNNDKYYEYKNIIKIIENIELSIVDKIQKNKIQIDHLKKFMKTTLDYYQVISNNLYAPP